MPPSLFEVILVSGTFTHFLKVPLHEIDLVCTREIIVFYFILSLVLPLDKFSSVCYAVVVFRNVVQDGSVAYTPYNSSSTDCTYTVVLQF